MFVGLLVDVLLLSLCHSCCCVHRDLAPVYLYIGCFYFFLLSIFGVENVVNGNVVANWLPTQFELNRISVVLFCFGPSSPPKVFRKNVLFFPLFPKLF